MGTNLPPRLFIDYLIPLPPETNDADIDPWPGGLAQQFPYASSIIRDILAGVVEDSPLSPDLDVAAVVFPGPDQYAKLKEIEDMVGDQRTLIVFNRQFTRGEDFGFFRKGEAKEWLQQYQWGFAFQEIACRGEDVKLTFEESLGWQACVVDENGREVEITDSSWDTKVRPEYEALEKKINEVLPEPLWMRKIQEAQDKGLKFQRKE